MYLLNVWNFFINWNGSNIIMSCTTLCRHDITIPIIEFPLRWFLLRIVTIIPNIAGAVQIKTLAMFFVCRVCPYRFLARNFRDGNENHLHLEPHRIYESSILSDCRWYFHICTWLCCVYPIEVADRQQPGRPNYWIPRHSCRFTVAAGKLGFVRIGAPGSCLRLGPLVGAVSVLTWPLCDIFGNGIGMGLKRCRAAFETR